MKKILLFTSILFLTITTSLFAQHPTALVASNATSTSVDLSWDASACGTSVNLRYREVGGVWSPNITNVISPYLLTGLFSNTDYEWTVQCLGISGWQANESFTTAIVVPTISSISIGPPILCFGGVTNIQININQTTPPTSYSCIVGYYIGSYFVSFVSTNITTSNSFALDLLAGDYCTRLVDSAAYYIGNGGSSSGTSTVGIYDEWCPITISEPTQLVASTSVVASNLCAGDCIAAEDLLISGGTGPYSFTVNGGSSQNLAIGVSTYSFTSLCAGLNDIVVTDADGCLTSPSITSFIIAPIPLIVPAGTITDFNGYHVSCNGGSDGMITAVATGGAGIFTYSKDGVNFQSSATFSSLSAGTYTITYMDANSCTTTEQLTLIEPPVLVGTTSITQVVDCFGSSTGEITFTVNPAQPGVPPYQYSIDAGVNFQSSHVFSNLPGNLTYNVMIEDDNGCQYISTIYLTEPAAGTGSTTITDCNSYTWSVNGSTYTTSGTYTDVNTNAAGCTHTDTLVLTINNSTSNSTPITDCDTYTWSVNGTTYDTGGTYTDVSTNSAGCTHTETLMLTINNYNINIIDTACGEFLWNGVIYDTNGIYTNVFTDINGCDSTVNLTLKIFEDSSVTVIDSECDSAQWNGIWYYNDTIVTTTGLTTTNNFGGTTVTSSGKEGNIWYFGTNSGIDFNSGSAVAITDGALNTFEGCATICDYNGGLLFYTDGITVYNKNHNVMQNGTNLAGNSSSTQSAIIIKQPGSNSIYYLFTVDFRFGTLDCRYSEIDINLDNGLGGIVPSTKNTLVLNPSCEKITAIQHQNGIDYWIIAHEFGSNNFYSYLLSSAGLGAGIPYASGSSVSLSANSIGYLRASADGSRLASARSEGNVELFNFNKTTGSITFEMILLTYSGVPQSFYGLEFSPNSNLLYISNVDHANADLYQFNLAAGSQADILNSQTTLGVMPGQGGALQLAPDGKIYNAQYGTGNNYLGEISNPDIVGVGCNYLPNSFYLAGKTSGAGLPTFYNSISISSPAGCDSVATAIITIKNSTSSTDTQVQCDSFTWALNGQTYYTSQIDTIQSINLDGCQHIDSLDLTINYSTSNLDTRPVCDSYFWPVDGNSYTTSGLYISSSTNIDGCLHTDSLDLTVIYSSSTYTAVIECDIYTWSVTSQPYTSSGLYVATSTNAAGCLHTDSLDLSILNSTTSIDNVGSHCDSFTWSLNGQTYYASQIDTVHSINADGCQHIDSLDLTIYPLINVTANIVDELCLDYSDGSIILNVIGGFGSFSYSWTGPNSFSSTTRDVFNLFPGVYDLTITDISSLCIKDTSFVIGAGFDMQLTTSSNDISCFGFADGAIDISPINLISPVYNWSDITSSIEDRNNLSPGVYYLQIDDNNCFVRDTFNITQPDSLFLIATQTNTTCANNTFGFISVQVSGGIPSYSYYWSNWINIPMNDGLPPGIYDLDIIDSNGCLLEKTFEISPYTVDISSIVDNVACYGDSTASIDLSVSGGFQTYSYLWSDNSINQDIYNLPEGNISCIVTDYLGCESITIFNITQENEIFSTPVVSSVSCFGGNDGSVILNIVGGVSMYNINWNNVDENNLSEGSYPYEITDANGCILQDTVYIPQEDSLVLDIIVIDLQCNGDPTGKIDVSIVSGGVGPFYYSWLGPNSFVSNQYIINNLYAGLYDLTVTDDSNCNVLYQISVTQPVAVSQDIDFELSNYSTFGISCKNGSDGWISATPTGGYIPYSFDWTGPGSPYSDNQSITDLSEGLYSVVVTNGLGCEEQFTFPINDPEDAISGVVSSLYDYNGYDISCYGFNDGGILVEPNGGVSPYTYVWDNVQRLNPLAFQESGLHLLTMYDNNGCPWESFIVLNQPDDLIWNTNMFPDTCEREVGKIIIDVNGGILPYNYLWSDSQNSAVATQLFEGEYSVEVIDKNGCQIFDTVSVSNLISPNMNFAIMSDYERLYKQLKDPIIFIDMTELTWQNALYWDWDFGDGTYGTDSIAFHSYQEIGEYDVLLTVTTDYNCIDTLRKKVVIEEYELFIPNAFTPNSLDDNINDEFRPYGIGIDKFRMKIYSRWDGLIYTTDDIEVGWNGKFENTGNEVQLGVYVYYIETKDVFGAIHKYEGQVTLIR